MAKFQGIKIRENAMVYILEIISLADFCHLGLVCAVRTQRGRRCEDNFVMLELLWMSIHGVKRGHHDQMMRHARGDPLIDKMSTGPVMVRCMLV